MNNCTPNGSIPVVDNPCAMLPALRAAYFQLAAGQARAQVRNGEMWMTWQRGDAKTLEREIKRLELMCGPNRFRPRAVRVGKY
jgi:hypothetical protein